MSKTGFAMFLAGATVGAAATWLCLRRYYEQITQEEIDSVKAAFAERKPVIANIAKDEKSNEKQEENQHKADIAKLKPDLVNYAAKLQEEGYTNYTEHSKKNTEEKKDEPNPRRNAEGYPDPTAYEALKNIDREEDERFHRLLHTLFYLCELADFEIEGRIILVDKRNGRVWR